MPAISYQSPWMNEELRLFRKTVHQFIQKEFVPHQARWRQQHLPDAEAWKAAGGAGILLPDLPEEYGLGPNGSYQMMQVIDALKAALQNRTLAKSRVDEAATRIITLKLERHLILTEPPSYYGFNA